MLESRYYISFLFQFLVIYTGIFFGFNTINNTAVQPLSLVDNSFMSIPLLSCGEQFDRYERKKIISLLQRLVSLRVLKISDSYMILLLPIYKFVYK